MGPLAVCEGTICDDKVITLKLRINGLYVGMDCAESTGYWWISLAKAEYCEYLYSFVSS